jgi:hypothetical protein
MKASLPPDNVDSIPFSAPLLSFCTHLSIWLVSLHSLLSVLSASVSISLSVLFYLMLPLFFSLAWSLSLYTSVYLKLSLSVLISLKSPYLCTRLSEVCFSLCTCLSKVRLWLSLHLPSIRPRHSLCCSPDQLLCRSKASTCIWELQRVITFTNTLRNPSCNKWTRHGTRRTTVHTRRVMTDYE